MSQLGHLHQTGVNIQTYLKTPPRIIRSPGVPIRMQRKLGAPISLKQPSTLRCVPWFRCTLYCQYCWWFRNPANPLRLVVYPSIYDGFCSFIHLRWLFGISCINSSVGCEFKADQCIIDFAQDKHDALESCAQNSHHRMVPKPHLRKQKQLHPGNFTWNLKMMVSNRNLLFQGLIFRFHVKIRGVS